MNYRLIIRWQRTCEVNTTLFDDADDAWIVMHCLDCAMENGAEVGYELQYRNENGNIEVIDCAGEPIGEWSNLRWD